MQPPVHAPCVLPASVKQKGCSVSTRPMSYMDDAERHSQLKSNLRLHLNLFSLSVVEGKSAKVQLLRMENCACTLERLKRRKRYISVMAAEKDKPSRNLIKNNQTYIPNFC